MLIWKSKNDEHLSDGEIIKRLIKVNLPGTPEEIIKQIKVLLKNTDVLNQTPKAKIKLNEPLETVQLIAQIAEAINVNFGVVVDAIATFLPKPPNLVIHKNGFQEYVYDD